MTKDAAARIAAFSKSAEGRAVLATLVKTAVARRTKVASDLIDHDIVARMEKTALPGFSQIRSGAQWLGGKMGLGGKAAPGQLPGVNWGSAPKPAAGTASNPYTLPRPMAQRAGGLAKRTAQLGAIGGAGTVGYQHLSDNADNSASTSGGMNMTANPLTWGRNQLGRNLGLSQGPSHEDVYNRNMKGYNQAASGIKAQMEAARASGDNVKLNELQQKMQSGNFSEDHGWDLMNGQIGDVNPLNYRMGGLNPFATQRGGYYRGNAMGAQNALQGQYDEAMGKVGPQSGDAEQVKALQGQMSGGNLLSPERTAIEQQLKMLQDRMKQTPGMESDAASQIKQRMQGVGMVHRPFKPTPAPGAAPAGQPGSGNWGNMGRRPQTPGFLQGMAMNPHDYRGADPWEAVMSRNSPTQFGG